MASVTKDWLEAVAVKDPHGCWLWPRAKIKPMGYGVLRIGRGAGVLYYLHRLAWELWKGPIPEKLCVLHRCDVASCYNPDHLFLGSRRDNNEDRDSKGRTRKGEKHADSILTVGDVIAMRERHRNGERTCDLAKVFGICRQAVYDVVARRNWKHVP
jgi:hypothetical protein